MNQQLILKLIGAVFAGGAWLAVILLGKGSDPSAQQFVLFCQLALATLLGHGLSTPSVPGMAAPTKTAAGGDAGAILPNGAVRPPLYVPGGQSGRVTPNFLIALAALAFWTLMVMAAIGMMVGCVPVQSQAQQIANACAVDRGLRPSVDVLLAIPGLAKPEEVTAVVAARAIIDPICANPSQPFPTDPTAQISQATATMAGVLVQLETRKAGPK